MEYFFRACSTLSSMAGMYDEGTNIESQSSQFWSDIKAAISAIQCNTSISICPSARADFASRSRTPEQLPAPIRGTACVVASFWGRLFGIIAPQPAQHLLPSQSGLTTASELDRVLYLAGGITLG